jgi:hypothetical protein
VREARKERGGITVVPATAASITATRCVMGGVIGSPSLTRVSWISLASTVPVMSLEGTSAAIGVNQYAPGSAAHSEFTELGKYVLKQLLKPG